MYISTETTSKKHAAKRILNPHTHTHTNKHTHRTIHAHVRTHAHNHSQGPTRIHIYIYVHTHTKTSCTHKQNVIVAFTARVHTILSNVFIIN